MMQGTQWTSVKTAMPQVGRPVEAKNDIGRCLYLVLRERQAASGQAVFWWEGKGGGEYKWAVVAWRYLAPARECPCPAWLAMVKSSPMLVTFSCPLHGVITLDTRRAAEGARIVK